MGLWTKLREVCRQGSLTTEKRYRGRRLISLSIRQQNSYIPVTVRYLPKVTDDVFIHHSQETVNVWYLINSTVEKEEIQYKSLPENFMENNVKD